jgi:hypothetical protein
MGRIRNVAARDFAHLPCLQHMVRNLDCLFSMQYQAFSPTLFSPNRVVAANKPLRSLGGVVVVGLRDELLRRELLGALAARDTDVTAVTGIGALCTRLITAPRLAPAPDVVVWDDGLASLLELDRVWHTYGEGMPPRFVLVQESGGLFVENIETCRPRCDAVLASVKRAMWQRRQRRAA